MFKNLIRSKTPSMELGGLSLSTSYKPLLRGRWSSILPACNFIAAAILLLVGHYQYREIPEEFTTTASGGEWSPARRGPVPETTQVAYAINFPALLVVSPLIAGPYADVAARPAFLVGVVILWYAVGHFLDTRAYRPTASRRYGTLALALAGLLVSLICVWLAAQAIGNHYLVPPLGALLWAALAALFCGYRAWDTTKSLVRKK